MLCQPLNENGNRVEVFQTNIQYEKAANAVLKALQTLFPHYRMNFDLEDCDNILRVESTKTHVEAEPIIKLVQAQGYSISVLPDIVPKSTGILDKP